MVNTLLKVRNLTVRFATHKGNLKAVDDISFDIYRGETLGFVGESGCGKSVTALSIMQLVNGPRCKIDGKIVYQEQRNPLDILSYAPNSSEMRSIRGNKIAMIFQEPMTSLNPVYTIGEQIMEAVILHQRVEKSRARKRAIKMLEMVGISAPEKRINEYPYQFSGGMRQRAMIGMALSCHPGFLIADEPTTALDVTIEAQILSLLQRLQKGLNMSIMLITHDLGVIGEMADRVNVMYTGQIIETAITDDIFYQAAHPYTKGLLNSIPRIGRKERPSPIEGSVPGLDQLPSGCNFAPRCPEALKVCRTEEPPIIQLSDDHFVKCWLHI